MTYNEALAEIVTWITDNNNKEITAAIMRDVLKTLLDFADENIGDTGDLFQETNTVDAINELKSLIDGIDLTLGLQVHNGTVDPNVTPPAGGYAAPDIYVREDDALKEVYIFNGKTWVQIINFSFPIYEAGIFKGNATSLDFVGGNFTLTYDAITGVMTVEVTGEGVEKLEDVGDVPPYPDDGQEWVLVEKDGDLTWELKATSGGITESALKNTLRSFSKPQWLDVAVLTAVSNVFTPDLGTAGSFTADLSANSTLANPTIPSGYDSGKVLAWDITFTITGAGGWTLAFGNQYFVDSGVDIATIISNNNTTGDKIQLFFQFKNNVISVQPFIPTAIP